MEYAQSVGEDMTETKYAPDAEMSSQERRYLKGIEETMESGSDIVRLAPSKLLRQPHSERVRITLPHGKRLDQEYKSYDIPWDLIDEGSVEPDLVKLYKFTFIEIFCELCEKRILVPYMMPRELIRIRQEAELFIDLPQHFCIDKGHVATVTKAESIIPVKHPWGNPALDKCRYTEIFRGTEIDYKQFECSIGGINPSQEGLENLGFMDPDPQVKGLTRLPMMAPFEINYGHPAPDYMMEAKLAQFSQAVTIKASVRFDITDIIPATYVYLDLSSAFRYHHHIALPLHIGGVHLDELKIENHGATPRYSEYGKYPYGDEHGGI